MKNKQVIIFFAISILLGVFVIATKVYRTSESKRLGFLAQEKSQLFVRDYSPVYGDADAQIFVTEFLDPECESCREFYPQVKDLLKQYEGKVKLVIRYAAFHNNSIFAIHALEAARKQGKYWEALEYLFHKQPAWGDHHNPRADLIFVFLKEIGIDTEQLQKDMEDPKIAEMIAQEMTDLRELDVRGTPTFFVNGKPLENFGIQYLKKAIEAEL